MAGAATQQYSAFVFGRFIDSLYVKASHNHSKVSVDRIICLAHLSLITSVLSFSSLTQFQICLRVFTRLTAGYSAVRAGLSSSLSAVDQISWEASRRRDRWGAVQWLWGSDRLDNLLWAIQSATGRTHHHKSVYVGKLSQSSKQNHWTILNMLLFHLEQNSKSRLTVIHGT